jgi:hypothetical protein
MTHDRHGEDQRLDAWLASSTPPPAPAHLRRAILSAAHATLVPTRPHWTTALRQAWRELGGLRIAAPVMAMALAIGLGAANHLWQTSMTNRSTDDLLELALIQGDYGDLLAARTDP